jgi:hypothetical protein
MGEVLIPRIAASRKAESARRAAETASADAGAGAGADSGAGAGAGGGAGAGAGGVDNDNDVRPFSLSTFYRHMRENKQAITGGQLYSYTRINPRPTAEDTDINAQMSVQFIQDLQGKVNESSLPFFVDHAEWKLELLIGFNDSSTLQAGQSVAPDPLVMTTFSAAGRNGMEFPKISMTGATESVFAEYIDALARHLLKKHGEHCHLVLQDSPLITPKVYLPFCYHDFQF